MIPSYFIVKILAQLTPLDRGGRYIGLKGLNLAHHTFTANIVSCYCNDKFPFIGIASNTICLITSLQWLWLDLDPFMAQPA